jgi:hypothetical protein
MEKIIGKVNNFYLKLDSHLDFKCQLNVIKEYNNKSNIKNNIIENRQHLITEPFYSDKKLINLNDDNNTIIKQKSSNNKLNKIQSDNLYIQTAAETNENNITKLEKEQLNNIPILNLNRLTSNKSSTLRDNKKSQRKSIKDPNLEYVKHLIDFNSNKNINRINIDKGINLYYKYRYSR